MAKTKNTLGIPIFRAAVLIEIMYKRRGGIMRQLPLNLLTMEAKGIIARGTSPSSLFKGNREPS